MLKGFPGNISELLESAQEMQKKMSEVQEGLQAKEVEASAGGGMVSVRVTGQGLVTAVSIDPEVIQLSEKEMLQDLIKAATNEAIRKSQAMMKDEIGKLTGGLQIPGLFPGGSA